MNLFKIIFFSFYFLTICNCKGQIFAHGEMQSDSTHASRFSLSKAPKPLRQTGFSFQVSGIFFFPSGDIKKVGGYFGLSLEPGGNLNFRKYHFGLTANLGLRSILLDESKVDSYFRNKFDTVQSFNRGSSAFTSNDFMGYCGIYYECEILDNVFLRFVGKVGAIDLSNILIDFKYADVKKIEYNLNSSPKKFNSFRTYIELLKTRTRRFIYGLGIGFVHSEYDVRIKEEQTVVYKNVKTSNNFSDSFVDNSILFHSTIILQKRQR